MARSSLKGSRALNQRLRAIKQTFKVAGRDWADETADQMRARVPERTGRLKRSFRRKNATQKRATVAGHYSAFFIDAGTKEHDVKARKAGALRWESRGRTMFARRTEHPRTRARPFREAAAIEALRRRPLAAALIRLWNRAA